MTGRCAGVSLCTQALDPALGGIEPRQANAVELLAALPQRHRPLQVGLARLELAHDALELLPGLLERELAHSTLAPKRPRASSTSTRSPVARDPASRTIPAPERTMA